jgi:hypothetical protein
MALGSPFKPKGSIVLQAPDNGLPGQRIPAEIRLTAWEEITPRAVRLELAGEETYYKTEYRNKSHHIVKKNETFSTVVQTVAEQPSISKDVEQKWACELQMPPYAAATSQGKLVHIRWTLKAVLDVPNRADLSQERSFHVFCPPGYQAGDAPHAEKSFGELTLLLKTPPSAPAGGVLKGELSLQIKEKLNVRSIRVELVKAEDAGTRNSSEAVATARISDEVTLSQLESPTYQFSLDIPPDVPPTAAGQHSSLRWKVRAVLDRKMKTDFNVEQEVIIYNSPKA